MSKALLVLEEHIAPRRQATERKLAPKTEASPGAQHEGLGVQLINGTPNQIIGAN